MKTKFSEKFKEKSDADLRYIIENPDAYQKEAVLTAGYELESRGVKHEKMASVKSKYEQQEKLTQKREKHQQNIKKIRSKVPKSISNAARLIYLSMGLGLISSITLELTLGVPSFSNPKNLIVNIITILILGVLAYQINLGKYWARNVYVVLTVLGFLMFPLVIVETFNLHVVAGIFSLTQVILQVVTLFLLLKSESRAWYKNEGSAITD